MAKVSISSGSLWSSNRTKQARRVSDTAPALHTHCHGVVRNALPSLRDGDVSLPLSFVVQTLSPFNRPNGRLTYADSDPGGSIPREDRTSRRVEGPLCGGTKVSSQSATSP